MPSIDQTRRDEDAVGQGNRPSAPATGLSDIEGIVHAMTFEGKLAELLAIACEQASEYEPPSHADPGQAPNPGVQAAIRAYSESKRIKEGSMDTDVRPHASPIKPPIGEPEVLPLSLAGKWVAWSSDGMRIVAASESSEEAEQLAIAAGEPEPILERHPGRYRL